MQVLLRKSDERKDIQCEVCGQGFRLYWERTSQAEQETMRPMLQDELRKQHRGDASVTAHPASPFNLPSWSGSAQFSGAALLGGLSTIRRAAPAELDYRRQKTD
jgi:hypothetical protein